ncbi:MAG TPA: sugar phosphate isomerase/epimerase family protein [Armatimonadota bacterium]|jgi:hexulose-6-phosphate isomerase
MGEVMDRRGFLAASAGVLAVGAAASAAEERELPRKPPAGQLRKAVIFGMLPDSMPMADRLKLAKDCGFDGIESEPLGDLKAAEERRSAAEAAGLEVHSVIYGGWDKPLSTGDPAVAAAGKEAVRSALRDARALGATSLLLVPGIVNEKTRYIDCYERSQRNVKDLIPEAKAQGVQILIEEVWNNFLMSPLEYSRYVDEFKSPWVQSYFDVGNVVAFAWPEDWIRTLGKRIRRLHLKDFKRGPRQFVHLRDGDINWPEVRKALAEVGYGGYMTAELNGGDAAYLKDLAARMDLIIAGK